MKLGVIDVLMFVAFIAAVVGISFYKSRRERGTEGYFLAGRGLSWPLIGLSLIAANISTEQFVGMSGQGAGVVGLAIASYEWVAAITLVFVAIFFLPRFLRSGIFTIPEYLEYRYNPTARAVMAFYLMVIYVTVTIAAVVYSGGLTIQTIFGFNLTASAWFIGTIAAVYTAYGGLKAVAWADLFQGSSLILGGLTILVLGLIKIGGVAAFYEGSAHKLHMILPADHPVLPWTALIVAMWIPNFYYWGLNQYITQKALAARSLRQGQFGVIFAAALKLFTPFAIVLPGIMALRLYGDQLTGPGKTTDAAYPLMIKNLVPMGLRGFIFAAICGAVISTLASMLNSASTIFTMDLYKRHFKKDASQGSLVTMGRITTVGFVLIACLIAPALGSEKPDEGIFSYIQEFQGFISSGILAAFAFGLVVKWTPPAAGVAALLLNPPVYGLLYLTQFHEIPFLHRIVASLGTYVVIIPAATTLLTAVFLRRARRRSSGSAAVAALLLNGAVHGVLYFAQSGKIAFLNRMAITFGCLILIMAFLTILKPLRESKRMPVKADFDMRSSPAVLGFGALVIAATIALYIIFW